MRSATMRPWAWLCAACMLVLLANAAHLGGVGRYTPGAEADRVHHLPGAPHALDFGLFAGYITVDEEAGRALFYVFAESRTRPREAPVLLWLNGGPGCSSLGGGFMSELGPYYPNKDGTSLQVNPYSWNSVANVLWLESPAYVGFSYSNSSADAIVGDERTAADARQFLLRWMDRFPQHAAADLYLSGESYGGHYVPNLALAIVKGNNQAAATAAAAAAAGAKTAAAGKAAAAAAAEPPRRAGGGAQQQQQQREEDEGAAAAKARSSLTPGSWGSTLNLKGIFVGNAWTDAAIDNRGALDFWYSHAMVGAESYEAISHNCDFNVIGPLMRGAQALVLPHTHTRAGAAAGAAAASNAAAAPAAPAGAPNDEGWRQRSAARAVADAANKASAPTGPAAGAGSSADSSSSSGSGSGLGHSRAAGWAGYGSSLTTRFWEALGLGGFSHRDSRDMICARWLDIAQAELGNINIYEIYADVCVAGPPDTHASSGSSSSGGYMGALLGDLPLRRGAAGRDGGGNGGGSDGAAVGHQPRRPRYDPCIDNEVEEYLNLPEVQAALHANQTVKLPWRWSDCTQQISYSREDLLSSMLPVYKQLLAATPALKLWVFSGDVDGIVPVLGSRRWIESLGLPVTKPWRAWTSSTGQVGGWRVDYEGLTFATVRNSGHMVPYVTPERAFSLLGQFLYGGPEAPAAGDGGVAAAAAAASAAAAAAATAAASSRALGGGPPAA